MKDFIGNELHVGDKVIYCNQSSHSAHMRKGVIVDIIEKDVPRIYWTVATVRGEDTHRNSLIYESTWVGSTTNILKYDW